MRKLLLPLALLIGLLIYFLYPRETAIKPLLSNKQEPASQSSTTKKKSTPPTRVSPEAMQSAGGSDFEDDPPGELRLEGQVVNDEGVPVPGAVVGVSSAPQRQTTTDEKGWFFFDKLVPRTYYVEARKDNLYGSASSPLHEETTPITVRMQEGSSVEVTVLDEVSRAPISNAEISWGWSAKLTANTDAQGKALIRGLDRWAWLNISADSYSPMTTDIQLSSNPEQVAKKTVLLQVGAMVSGVVLGPDGEPVAKARVEVEADRRWGLYSDDDNKLMSDEQGKWSLPTLSAGTYRFSASSEELSSGSSEPITLDGKTPKEGVEIRLEAGGVVTGRVVTSKGAPVVGAMVRATEDAEDRGRNYRRDYTDADGKFTLKGLPLKPLVVGASSPEGEIATPQLANLTNGTAEVTLTLDIGGIISGVVVNQNGEPIAEANVSAFPISGVDDRKKWRMKQPRGTISDPDGKFELKGIVEGEEYSLDAEFPGMSFGAWTDKENVVKARAGAQDVKLVLKAKGAAKGRVQFKDGSIPKEYSVSVGWESTGEFTDKDNGAFLLEQVAPGKQTATVQGASFRFKMSQQFEVRSGETTDVGVIIVDGGRTVKGRVIAGGAPVPNAVVAVGWVSGGGSRLEEEQEYNKKNRTLSKEDGSFAITGLEEDSDFTAIAEHPTLGRSKALKIEKNTGNQEIELTLSDGGSLEGILTQNGKPVEGYVSTRDESNSGANFGVSSGPDGKFRFDFLVPGTYQLTAQRSRFGLGDISSSKTVSATVELKKTAKVKIELPTGVTVIVSPMQYGKIATRASINFVAKSITPKDTDEFYEMVDDLPGDAVITGAIFGFIPGATASPVKFKDVPPGEYTMCVEQSPPQEMFDTMSEEDREKPLPILCQPQTIAASPAEQSITINIPEWYPPENP